MFTLTPVSAASFQRFAASLGYLDWATQPGPFRRYSGADLARLSLPPTGRRLPYGQLYVPGAVPPEPLCRESVSIFFRYALSLTAWKRFGETTLSLRANLRRRRRLTCEPRLYYLGSVRCLRRDIGGRTAAGREWCRRAGDRLIEPPTTAE